MSTKYRIEYFSNDDQCWFDDDGAKSFSTLDSAVAELKRCVYSDPTLDDMAHRIVKIETIALAVRGETLIAGA